jgi:serine/threonine protein kinase/tetratricopeptide (TPR) repeat protein
MAEVFKAKSYGVEGFEKILVIKRILPELSRSQDFVEMFIHEAKLAVRLSHANIVQVFDLGRVDPAGGSAGEAYYIAMEYVSGLDLASVLARLRRQRITVPIQMGVYVASEVAKGLDHAHRRRDELMRPLGIVHRDVSPHNVLLSFEGEVKVTDFGIAKARGVLDGKGQEDTQSRALQGKFGYMSPEQARAERVDARSDLFSLGTLLYECVAGVNPFSAPTTFETLRRVQACEFPPVELLRPEVPPDLSAILRTAMAKSPADRYPDAGRMYEALLAFLYSHGSRYGAHDLAELLSRLRESSGSARPSTLPADPLLEAEAGAGISGVDRTPVEVPGPRRSSSPAPGRAQSEFPNVGAAVELGERREVTCLQIEVPRETPEAVLEKAAVIVDRWGGRVVRRDSAHLAALFGLRDPDGRDTEMATRCALVALRSLDASLGAGAGIHTGRVHVSRAGDPVDDDRLAALLDVARDLARVREGRAAMSTSAMRQVKHLFEVETMSEGDRPAADVPAVLVAEARGSAEGLGRFVGRKDELKRIGEVLAVATRRNARVLTIRGDNGVGKTRLLHEVERRLRRGGYNVGFHIASCPPRGNEFPLSGIVAMLQVLCGINEGDSNERILSVQPRLRALGLRGEDVNAVLALLGASVAQSRGNANARLRQAFARMVQSLCEDRPHAFAWDAAHCMDEDSFVVLEEVLRRSRQARVVFVFAGRAGFSHPLERAEEHVALDMGDLTAADAERLVALRLGVQSVPDELLRFIRARAGGHPLFAEEVIKALVEGGAVTVADGRIVAMKLVGQDLALPKTLRGLVASRVARLADADRATLQAAAVLDDPVDVNVLSVMLSQAVPSLERSIATLKDREFVVHRAASELRFTSPIIPEIVVDSLTPEAARQMHAAAGQALEATYGDRTSDHAAQIARQLYQAGDLERAASYFATSGERRLETRQLEAATRDFARALTLAEPSRRGPEELAAWLEGLAASIRLVRSVPDATELCERVVQRVDQVGARELRVRVRVAAGDVLASVQHIEDSRQRLAEAREIAGDDERLVRPVLRAEAELAAHQGHFARAWRLLHELHGMGKSAGDARENLRFVLQLAHANAGRGDRATAFENLREAEDLLPDDRVAVVERARTRALVDYHTRDFRSAAAHTERAIEMGRELGLTYEVTLNLHNLGDILMQLDDLPRAYGAIRQSLALCEEYGFERLTNHNRMVLAFLDGLQGAAEAEKTLRHGVAYAESKDFTWDIVRGHLLLARLLHHRGDLAAARDEYVRTGVLAEEAGHRLLAEEAAHALQKLAQTAPFPA